MPAPRVTLVLAAVCLALGLSITAHNLHIEASGATESISFVGASTREVSFRPHWASLHYVSLLLTASGDARSLACVDSQGFAERSLDLQWEVRSQDSVVAAGRPSDCRLSIARGNDRVLVMGSFEASPRELYTLRIDIDDATGTCASLDHFAPRIEIGQRPGRPLLAYSLSGHVLLLVGAAFLFGFTRRKDKSWPYLQILDRVVRRRGRPDRAHGRA